MATFTRNVPEQGQLVRVRLRRWVVNAVTPSALPAAALKPELSGPQHLLSLTSVEDDGLGEELEVVWEGTRHEPVLPDAQIGGRGSTT